MKVNRYEDVITLEENGTQFLEACREFRGFDAEKWVYAKRSLIQDFMKKNGRDTVILGISGGIDSAVAYKILKGIPSITVFPVNIQIRPGTTDQDEGKALSLLLGDDIKSFDISTPMKEMAEIIFDATKEDNANVSASIWAQGQFASCLRSPAYYFIASLLSDQGLRPVVCGTINRSEGAYLGYWGKTSDAAVDIQILSDLFKSEVISVARYLGVPEEIVNATPKGDVYDGSSDESLFGVSYDCVELFISMKDNDGLRKMTNFDCDAPAYWADVVKRIDMMHSYNAHKYTAPAFGVWGNHLNVIEAGCPGGWPTKKVVDNYPTLMHGEFKLEDE